MPYDLNIRGWMPEHELQILEHWATHVPEHGNIVEIGSMMGRTAVCWAKSSHPTVKVYCIDSWLEYPIRQSYELDDIDNLHNIPIKTDINSMAAFIRNTIFYSNIIPIRVDSPENFPQRVKELTPNIMFLDASHCNPSDWNYINFWLDKIIPGGMLCGHDFNCFPDVTENVHRIEKILNKNVTLYPDTSLWSFKI